MVELVCHRAAPSTLPPLFLYLTQFSCRHCSLGFGQPPCIFCCHRRIWQHISLQLRSQEQNIFLCHTEIVDTCSGRTLFLQCFLHIPFLFHGMTLAIHQEMKVFLNHLRVDKQFDSSDNIVNMYVCTYITNTCTFHLHVHKHSFILIFSTRLLHLLSHLML